MREAIDRLLAGDRLFGPVATGTTDDPPEAVGTEAGGGGYRYRMSGEAKDPWYHRNLWSGLILIGTGLVAGTIWTSLQATLKSVPPLVSVLAVLVIAVAVVGLAVKRFRRWLFDLPAELWSFRPTTVRRYARAQTQYTAGYANLGDKHSLAIAELNKDHEASLKAVEEAARDERERQVAASSAQTRQHQMDLAREHDLTMSAVASKEQAERESKRLAKVAASEFTRGREFGRKDVEFGPNWEQKSEEELESIRKERRERDAKQRTLRRVATSAETIAMVRSMGLHAMGGPPPDPRWRLMPPGGSAGTYELRSLVPRSVSYDVRVECDEEELFINDAAFWPDLHGENSGTFEGELTRWGRTHGATLWLHWKDENQTERRKELVVPATDSPPPVRFDMSASETPF